jgi:Trypsin-like peptidase domain
MQALRFVPPAKYCRPMVRGLAWRAVLGAAVLLTGCVQNARESRIAGRFSARTGCPFEQIDVERDRDAVVARGCGKSSRYECYEDNCQSLDDLEGASPKEPPGERRRVTVLQLVLVLEGAGGLLLTASPQETEEAEMSLDAYAHRDCELDLMVDGQLLELAKGPSKPSLVLPRDVVLALASAQQVGVRACEKRWSLPASDLKQLHRFGRRYAEELAWQGTPSNGASAGRRPPLGGWQPWRGLEAFPPALPAEAALSGTQLFEKLGPSVWRVETRRDGGASQGSAVAVSKNRLLTNCHVLEGALKVVLRQGQIEVVAKLEESDPVKDRCVLGVAEAQLKPVAGVRPFADLKVGEPLYALGAPSGLDLTLADGILSGRREEEGVRYVQTTTPISPGSSGGGLFDARGNLVGITTLSFVGKERLNQSLNFAIAAEMYWSP